MHYHSLPDRKRRHLGDVPAPAFTSGAVLQRVRLATRRPSLGGMDDVDAELERTIDELLDCRATDATICPSEAARAVDPEGWRELMPAARAAAARLAAAGRAEVTQRGEVVDVGTARGPVRVRRPR